MKVKFLLIIMIFTLATMACSFSVNLPSIKTGAMEQLIIKEAVPVSGDPAHITLEMGAGILDITGGSPDLIDGTIDYNVASWKPKVVRSGDDVDVIQNISTKVSLFNEKVENTWTLRLGDYPVDLLINAGAYKGTIDLSGVPITDLEINDGASQAKVRFDSVNPAEMRRLAYKTGASQVTLTGLANANAEEIVFKGGTGDYELDFSGTLQRETHVLIAAGLSNVKLIFPPDMNVQVSLTGGLSNVSPSDIWTIKNGVYERSGSTPLVRVDVEMGVGNLQLSVR